MIPQAKEFDIAEAVNPVHEALMKESFMYRYAVEQKWAYIVCRMQLAYVEKQLARRAAEGKA